MGEQSGDKTEEPTSHKLREARKKGQVAKSKEITTAILVLVSYYVFKSTAERMWLYMVDYSKQIFELIPHSEYVLSMSFAIEMVWHGILIFFLITAPIFLATFVVAILVEGAQTGFNVSSESITPKFSKLNPLEGIKRMFSVKGLVQILISLVKIIIVSWITWNVIKERLPEILGLMAMPHWSLMMLAAQLVFDIAMKVGMFYILIAAFDYFWQKRSFKKSMMMTKQEVKEEYKRLEGDPTIKQRQKQVQREMAQKRQMGQVPKADVVVTNPIHIAVAIGYDPKIMKSPQVLAKGKRLIAATIKRLAEENNIPIVENIELAHNLYNTTEPGNAIPPNLYRAVAEVLAFVYRLGRNRDKPKV
jgi:flagellar biosynthetic protein FlhB